jgi:hypothetical protein
MSVDSMIQTAEQSLGLSGRPNVLTEDYASRNGQEYAAAPWCDEAVTEWARQSGNYDQVCPGGEDFAYTVAHAQAFADAGQWTYGTDGIRRGDIAFFDWDGHGSIAGIDHVGVVTGTSGAYVFTIEANSGDQCARRARTADTIVGYGRPAYASDQPAPTPDPAPAPAPAPQSSAPAWPGEIFQYVPGGAELHDDNVRTWQQRMADRGWTITVDGWYGPQSAAVALAFQQDSTAHGWPLTDDGEVGPLTWAASWDRPIS